MRRLLVVGFGLALVLTGCANEGSGGGPAAGVGSGQGSAPASSDPVSVALQQTQAQDSMHMAFRMRLEFPGQPKPLAVTGDGDFSYSEQLGRMRMEYPNLGTGVELGTMEMIMDGTTVYMRSAALSGMIGAGTDWIRIDAGDAGTSGFGSLAPGQNDISQSLDYFRGAVGEVESVGEEDIEGISTTHYRMRLDLAKALEAAREQLPKEQAERLGLALDQLGLSGASTTLPADLWIDGDGLVRRMSYEFSMPGLGQQSGSMVMTIDLSEFGEPLDVAPPPAKDVTDVNDLTPAPVAP